MNSYSRFLLIFNPASWIKVTRREITGQFTKRASKISRDRKQVLRKLAAKGERGRTTQVTAYRGQAKVDWTASAIWISKIYLHATSCNRQQSWSWRHGWIQATVLEASCVSPANRFSCWWPAQGDHINTRLQRTREEGCLRQNTGKEESAEGIVLSHTINNTHQQKCTPCI